MREQPLAVDDEAGVGVARDLRGLPVEADPRRRHGVGVDVVEEVGRVDIGHAQVELAASCRRISSGSLVRKRTRLPGVRRTIDGGFMAAILPLPSHLKRIGDSPHFPQLAEKAESYANWGLSPI